MWDDGNMVALDTASQAVQSGLVSQAALRHCVTLHMALMMAFLEEVSVSATVCLCSLEQHVTILSIGVCFNSQQESILFLQVLLRSYVDTLSELGDTHP